MSLELTEDECRLLVHKEKIKMAENVWVKRSCIEIFRSAKVPVHSPCIQHIIQMH